MSDNRTKEQRSQERAHTNFASHSVLDMVHVTFEVDSTKKQILFTSTEFYFEITQFKNLKVHVPLNLFLSTLIDKLYFSGGA